MKGATQPRKSIKKVIARRIKEWMLDTDIHGLPNIARSNRLIVQLIWAVCFILSSGTCGFLVVRTINEYVQHEVVSKYDVIYETPTLFPAVTICNQNAFATQKGFRHVENILKKNNMSYDNFTDIAKMESKRYPGLALKQSVTTSKFLSLLDAELSDTPVEIEKSFGFSLNEFLISCEFEALECADEDFEWHFDSVYGSCFKYGGATPKITTKVGHFDGLIIQLFVGLGAENASLAINTGAHVFIHNHTIEPTTYEGYEVAPGTSTSFVISREFNHKLPEPFNHCYDDLTSLDAYDSELYQEIVKSNHTYRQVDCFRLCFQKQMVAECGCLDPSVPKLNGASLCRDYDQLICLNMVYGNFKVDYDCMALCPLECSSYNLNVNSHFANFPSESYGNYMRSLPIIQSHFPNQTITYSMVKNSVLELKVYYEQTAYKLIVQTESLSIIDMIATIGGTLGLFLGVSFLSLIEIVEVTLDIFLHICEHFHQNSKIK